jgi:hypothetical protein
MEVKMMTISIGRIPVTFLIRNRRLLKRIAHRYRGFIVKNGKDNAQTPCISCTFSCRKHSSNLKVKLEKSSNNTWHASRYDFDCTWDERGGNAFLWPSLYSFDAMLRVLSSFHHMRHAGLLLHASAVVRNNQAFVFAGPSGNGKTTIARLSRSSKILNDEIISLRIQPDHRVVASGTPFWGEMGSGPAYKTVYRVQSIFFLKKDTSLYAQSIDRAVAVRKLLRCVCLFSTEPGDLQICLDTCSKVVKTVACRELHFPKKPLDWEKLEA